MTDSGSDERFAAFRELIAAGVPHPEAAQAAGIPLRTAQRRLAAHRRSGAASLTRSPRSDAGIRKFPRELVELVEGLALRRPPPAIAHIHRIIGVIASEKGWPVPSYTTVRSIIATIDPAMLTLAHHDPARYRDTYELVYRRESTKPNAIWQADHTELDLMVIDRGKPARPG